MAASRKVQFASAPSHAPLQCLARFYERNGYVRRRTLESVSASGQKSLRNADELRFTAQTPRELVEIRRALQHAGFKAGRPFTKRRQLRIPVYGRRAVDRFLQLIGRTDAAKLRAHRRSRAGRAGHGRPRSVA
jgi:hypothetical protein